MKIISLIFSFLFGSLFSWVSAMELPTVVGSEAARLPSNKVSMVASLRMRVATNKYAGADEEEKKKNEGEALASLSKSLWALQKNIESGMETSDRTLPSFEYLKGSVERLEKELGEIIKDYGLRWSNIAQEYMEGSTGEGTLWQSRFKLWHENSLKSMNEAEIRNAVLGSLFFPEKYIATSVDEWIYDPFLGYLMAFSARWGDIEAKHWVSRYLDVKELGKKVASPLEDGSVEKLKPDNRGAQFLSYYLDDSEVSDEPLKKIAEEYSYARALREFGSRTFEDKEEGVAALERAYADGCTSASIPLHTYYVYIKPEAKEAEKYKPEEGRKLFEISSEVQDTIKEEILKLV